MIDHLEATRYRVNRLTDELVVASLGTSNYALFQSGVRALNFYL